MKIIINEKFSIVKKPVRVDNEIILAEGIIVVEQQFLLTNEQKIIDKNGDVVNIYEILGSFKIDRNTIYFIKFNN